MKKQAYAGPGRSPGHQLATVLAISVAVFPGVLSTAMLSMGMVQMGDAFGVPFQEFQIRNSVFFTVFASGVLLGGAVAAALGERRSIMIGQLLFVVAAAISGLTQDWTVFVAAQALLAAADGFIVPAQMNLLRASVPEDRVGWAFGWFEGTLATASLVGPVLGAAVVAHVSWRHMFTILVILGLVVFVLGIFFIPRDVPRQKTPLPPITSVLAFGFCAILGQLLTSSAEVSIRIFYGVLFVAALSWLAVSEARQVKRHQATLIPWGALRRSAVALAVLRIFLVFVVSNAFTLHAPAALASFKALPLEVIGGCFTFTALVSVVLQPITGRFADRNERAMIVLGLILVAIGSTALTALPHVGVAAVALLVSCLLVMRVGGALFAPAQLRAASLAAPPEQRGAFMGFYMFVQFVSGAFSASLLGPVITNASGVIDHESFNRFLLVCAGLLVAATLTTLRVSSPNGPGHDRMRP